ncbi:N-acetylmuramoyl-L-alanine amidase family protein [Candidatus Protochlamydia sp. W-9]|uniref:N-acetylmuramoyl-L-alanine amidase family protein n=1 Tax=Candidatus Protochlamydia sp. W-9 TaxID=1785087 RepID=UPI00096A54D8|nr:N-acetylmuramoyl-L-alanine amidase [Candidatus Protochlamydia sp. W-9]
MSLIRCIFFCFFILISQSSFGCNFHDFDSYQSRLTAKEIEWKIKTYLEKNEAIKRFYRLTPQVLYIGDLDHQQIDYILKLNTNSPILPNKHSTYNGLKNIRIAIDPGHFGGSLAELEERYVAIPAEMTKNNQPIRFHEGDLTYLTALELQRLLENEGAVVLLTRSGIGQGAIKKDFFEWIKTHSDLIQNVSSLSQVFRNYYNREDLEERAKIINEFSPDVTIVIHYNSHLTDEKKKKKSLLTKTNYNLAFIPGAFGADELNTIRDRYEFLRLIVTNQINESLKLSEYVTGQFIRQLGIPLISEYEKTSYIDSACLIQKPGIYSRNLALTRLVHSPVCYGETLVQNNQDEIYKLSEADTSVENIPCPKRVKAVAQAYYEGIKEYFKNR